jgi:hypothetical protein
VQHSYYKWLLDEAKQRATSAKGQSMKRSRSATVEPVWGTLINFTGIKRINARGLSAANKCRPGLLLINIYIIFFYITRSNC